MSGLEDEARQISADSAVSDSEDGCSPTQQVQHIKASVAALMDQSKDQVEMIHRLTASRAGVNEDLDRVLDSLQKKETALVRRPLTLEVDSVDVESSRLTNIGQQVEEEYNIIAGKLVEQETIYSDLDVCIPRDIQEKIAELQNLHSRIKVHKLC